MSERPAFRDSILAAEDVQRLLKRLTLVERFHAVMVTCEMPRVTNEWVDILLTEVSARRGTDMRVARLDPYAKRENVLAPISEHWLLDEVLEKLVFPPPEHQGSSVLTIVDASCAMPADDDAWSILFQRMNERRNAIMQAIPGPFLVVGPKRYVALVGRSAPDLWSVVGAIVDVPTPAMDEEWREVGGDEESMYAAEYIKGIISTPAWDEAEAQQALSESRHQFAQYPTDAQAALLVAIALLQLGSLRARQTDSNAIVLLDESLQILLPHIKSDDNHIVVECVALSYMFRGFAHVSRNQIRRALNDFEESVRWGRLALKLEPQSAGIATSLAAGLLVLGVLYRGLNNVDRAAEYFLASLAQYRAKCVVDNDALSIENAVAFVHDELGRIFCAKHDWDQAWAHFDEAAKLYHGAAQRNPSDAHALSSFASTRFSMSKLQWLRGDVGRARALGNEALKAIELCLNVAPVEPPTIDLAAKIRAYVARWP